MTAAGLQCQNLSVDISGRTLVRALSMNLRPGNFVGLLGTNGVGKTLTLQTLAGLLRAREGCVRLHGDALATLTRKEIAQRLGMLLQIHEDTFPLTVKDSIAMGRYPRLSLLQWNETGDDSELRDALTQFDLTGLDERLLATLSGGERERVALATLMVQDPDIWLLDEPMNHLDPQHQLAVLRILRATADRDRVVLASLHNPAMALRFTDHVLMLYGDGDWEFGPTGELLDPERLERMYGTAFAYYSNGERQIIAPT